MSTSLKGPPSRNQPFVQRRKTASKLSSWICCHVCPTASDCIKWCFCANQMTAWAQLHLAWCFLAAMTCTPAQAGPHQIRGWKAWAGHPFFVPEQGLPDLIDLWMCWLGHLAVVFASFDHSSCIKWSSKLFQVKLGLVANFLFPNKAVIGIKWASHVWLAPAF